MKRQNVIDASLYISMGFSADVKGWVNKVILPFDCGWKVMDYME